MAQHPAGMSDGDWDEAADQFYEGSAVDRERTAFMAGFLAHPEAGAPVFKWSFAAGGCVAADREESAWQAYCELRKAALRGPTCAVCGRPFVPPHACPQKPEVML